MEIIDSTKNRHIILTVDRCSTTKVWKSIYGVFRIGKKCFWVHLMHFNIILSILKFGRKIEIFGFFRPKNAWKIAQLHLSSAKNGAKMHFKRKKTIFSKSADWLDVFCTFSEFLTPKTDISRNRSIISSDWLQICKNLGWLFCPFFRVFKPATWAPFKAKFRGEGAVMFFPFFLVSQ